jgi:hypothetical protein
VARRDVLAGLATPERNRTRDAKTSNWAIRIPLLCAAVAAVVAIALYNYTLLLMAFYWLVGVTAGD